MTAQPLVELTAVRKRYPAQAAGPFVLDGVDLTIEPGAYLSVVGPSGCGKSTLLNLIAGLDRPTEGTVRLAGQDLAELDESARSALRARRVGLVFQKHLLLPQCTALENVLAPTLARPRPEESANDLAGRARKLLAAVGLGDLAERFPGELSLGQAQRVALARALIRQPELLLADEPTGSLDEASAAISLELLETLCRDRHAALVLVTHNPSQAARAAVRLAMRAGRVEPAP